MTLVDPQSGGTFGLRVRAALPADARLCRFGISGIRGELVAHHTSVALAIRRTGALSARHVQLVSPLVLLKAVAYWRCCRTRGGAVHAKLVIIDNNAVPSEADSMAIAC